MEDYYMQKYFLSFWDFMDSQGFSRSQEFFIAIPWISEYFTD